MPATEDMNDVLSAMCPRCNRAAINGDGESQYTCECGHSWRNIREGAPADAPPPLTGAPSDQALPLILARAKSRPEQEHVSTKDTNVKDSSRPTCKACVHGTRGGHTCRLSRSESPKAADPPSPSEAKPPPPVEKAPDHGSLPLRVTLSSRSRKSAPKRKRPPVSDVTKYCGLCCNVDNSSKLLCCYVCGNSGHRDCLNMSKILWKSCMSQKQWLCVECKICMFCSDKGDEDSMLLCDKCDGGVHMYCAVPPITSKPDGEYVCPKCAGVPGYAPKHRPTPLSRKIDAMKLQFAKNHQAEGSEDDDRSSAGASAHTSNTKRHRVETAPETQADGPPKSEFAIQKRAVLLGKYQARIKNGDEASAALVEYCRFMTLKVNASRDASEYLVAPTRVRDVWKLHVKVDDYAIDCQNAGVRSPIEFQHFLATDSPFGATGAKVRTIHAYFMWYGHWPPFREWAYGDEAVDCMLEALPRAVHDE